MQLRELMLVVRDYDEAIAFYVGVLGFELVEDTIVDAGKRWVRVRPPGSTAGLVLGRAVGAAQLASVGNQAGGRVLLFVETDDFARDRRTFEARGVRFLGPTRHEPYGTVAVFEDLYGNKLDLIEPLSSRPRGRSSP